MKNSAKFFTAFLAVVTLALGFILSGCIGDDRGTQDDKIENGHTIVYAFTADERLMTADDGSMLDYMNALKANGDLTFEGSESDYGFYIASVLGVSGKAVSSTASSYSGWDWYVYTTLTTLDGVIYSGEESLIIDGVTFYKASYGVSGIPCVAGESYALVYELSTMTW